jgi:hypothetical protein
LLLRDEEEGECCGRGEYQLEPWPDAPQPLVDAFTGPLLNNPTGLDADQLKHLRTHPIAYNSHLSFASISSKRRAAGAGPPIVLLNGQIAYNIGDVNVHVPGNNPAFAQLWTLTAEEANAASTTAAEGSKAEQRVVPHEEELIFLRDLIRRHNSLARTLLTAKKQMEREELRLRELGEEVIILSGNRVLDIA